MNETVQQLLNNQGENYILPFFWQHGETEEVLREYMAAIDASNIKAVCVESRPHPDFCGEKWWQDMDVILDEARKRHMKVWILDDSHFPTGFANGELKDYPDCYCRQSICCREMCIRDRDGACHSISLWVAYYNFLRPHAKTGGKDPLNKVELLEAAGNMPGKWQLLIYLGQQTILEQQKAAAADCS